MERVCPECGIRTDELTCPQDGEMTLVVKKKDEGHTGRIGEVIGGRYRIQAVIGQGGFGAVFKAQHTATGDTVAIKVLRTDVQGSQDVVARFRQEAKATSRLKHPNTVRVFDFGQMDDGNLFLAMEFLEGGTFSDLLRKGPLEPRRLVHIAVQVLKALSEAHSKGLVHRDLKPDNIFLQQVHGEPDHVRVLDFGIAKSLSGESTADMTSTGAIIGTPRYMSPEQARGTPVDARTDLYSLGIILYEGLTGTAPFLADSPLSMLLRRVAEEPPRVHELLALPTPQGLCDAVLMALARDVDDRFASADEMIAALQAGLDTPLLPARTYVALPSDAQRIAGAHTVDETLGAGEPAPQLVVPTAPVDSRDAETMHAGRTPEVELAARTALQTADSQPTRVETVPAPRPAPAVSQATAIGAAVEPRSAERPVALPARRPWLVIGVGGIVAVGGFVTAVAVLTGSRQSAPLPPPTAIQASPTVVPAVVAPPAAAALGAPAPAEGTVRIVRQPADALLSVDGRPMTDDEMRLAPGRHVLEATRAGFASQRQELEVRAGETQTVYLTLQAAPPAVPPEPTAQVQAEPAVQPKVEPRVEPRREPRPTPRAEPTGTSPGKPRPVKPDPSAKPGKPDKADKTDKPGGGLLID